LWQQYSQHLIITTTKAKFRVLGRHTANAPGPIMAMFQQGAFVVSVLGRPWHSVVIDECHEMLINKDYKASIVRPLPDFINRIARYIPYRSKNFQSQLFPTKKDQYQIIDSPLSSNPNVIKFDLNVQAQIQATETSKLLIATDTNCGLTNPFSKKEARPGQLHDLLNFHSIGQQEFLLRISSVILKNPSVQAHNIRRRLQTFSKRKPTKSRITQLEKEADNVSNEEKNSLLTESRFTYQQTR